LKRVGRPGRPIEGLNTCHAPLVVEHERQEVEPRIGPPLVASHVSAR
jgi:hypothetical protein